MSRLRPRIGFRLRILMFAGFAWALGAAGAAFAQSSVPNPLRGKPAEENAAEKPRERSGRAARPKPEEKAETPARPRRERSEKQKENDEIMRTCGASWRAEKASLQAKGETWRSYLKDCRAKRKGEQRA